MQRRKEIKKIDLPLNHKKYGRDDEEKERTLMKLN